MSRRPVIAVASVMSFCTCGGSLHVGLQVVDLAAGVLQRLHHLGLRHAGGHDDVRAGLGERGGDAEADAAGGAGDEGDLSVEAEAVEDHACGSLECGRPGGAGRLRRGRG